MTKEIVLKREDNEIKLTLAYEYEPIKGRCRIALIGNGDLNHHLVEGAMRLINDLAQKLGISHKIL